jgi:putative acetyltransferase
VTPIRDPGPAAQHPRLGRPVATIDVERPDELDAVRDVVTHAFGDDAEHVLEMLDGLRATPEAWIPGLSFVARVDDEPVGHALLTRCWIDTDRGRVDALTLTPLSVAPEHQGQGIGTALVGHALSVATAGGWPLVLLEGDPHFYGRRGFSAAEPLGFPSPAPEHIPPGAYQVALLPDHEPWMTGTLVQSGPLEAINDLPRF